MAESEAWVMIPKLDKDKTGCILDMRPLVLCKECRYGMWTKNLLGEDRIACVREETFVQADKALPPEWFCADGERRGMCE